MLIETVTRMNLRDNEGNFKDPNILCSICGETREVLVEYKAPNLIVRACKGCLSDSIDLLNKSFIEEIKHLKRDETT